MIGISRDKFLCIFKRHWARKTNMNTNPTNPKRTQKQHPQQLFQNNQNQKKKNSQHQKTNSITLIWKNWSHPPAPRPFPNLCDQGVIEILPVVLRVLDLHSHGESPQLRLLQYTLDLVAFAWKHLFLGVICISHNKCPQYSIGMPLC